MRRAEVPVEPPLAISAPAAGGRRCHPRV